MLWPSVRLCTARNTRRSTDTADDLLNAPTDHHNAGNEHHREHHHDHHHNRAADHLDNGDKCPSLDDNYSNHSRGNDDNFRGSSDDGRSSGFSTSHKYDDDGTDRRKSSARNFDDHNHRRQYHHPRTRHNLDDHNRRSSGSIITTDNVSRTAAYNIVSTGTHSNRHHPDRGARRVTRRRATSPVGRTAGTVRGRGEYLLRQVRLVRSDRLTCPGQRTPDNYRGDYNGRGEHSRTGKEAAMNWLRENVWVYVGTGLVLLTLTGPTLKNALLLSLTGTAIHLFATYFEKD